MWMFKTKEKENNNEDLNEMKLKIYMSEIEEGISSICSVFIFDVESI